MMRTRRHFRRLALIAVLAVACVLPMHGRGTAGGSEGVSVAIDATVETLDNGLKVILVEDHSVPVLSRQTFFRVGSRNERPGITGISHFMEHMMFNGADKYGPKEFDRVLESNGGYSNAFTSNDMTAYYEDISSDGLALVMDLDSDRLRSLMLDPKFLESEIGVVKEERRLSIDNSVGGQLYEDLQALAFKAHPYQWPVLGWMSDLEGISRNDCVEYFRTFYAPNNAVLVIVGDFDTKDAIELVREYYGSIPSQEPPSKVYTSEPVQKGERRAEVHMAAELPELRVGYHGPEVGSNDIYALDVLSEILTGGNSSRLYRKLVRELEAVISVDSYFPWRLDPSLFNFTAKMKPGHAPREAEDAIYAELEAIAGTGVAESELDKAKTVLEADFVRSMQTVNGKATKMGRYEILFGDYHEILNVPQRYRAVTSEDIKRVVADYLHERNRSVVTLVPEGS